MLLASFLRKLGSFEGIPLYFPAKTVLVRSFLERSGIVVDGDPDLPQKSRAQLAWVVAIVGVAVLFAALVAWRLTRPEVVDPPREVAVDLAAADQKAEQKAATETVAVQPETPAAVAPEPEPVPDFDARHFSAEFTMAQGAEIWPELFGPDVVPQPFLAAALRDSFSDVTDAEWQRWLDPVENEPADVSFEVRSGTPIVHLRGKLQLRCPWPRDGVLHLTPLDSQIILVMFWNGTKGVALVYHPQAGCTWAADSLERTADSRRPKSIALVAIDKGDSPENADRGFDIHLQSGQLIVSCGGNRLLTAPFAGVPQSVYLMGDCTFRTFGIDRRVALAGVLPAEGASGNESERFQDLEWFVLPGEAGRPDLSFRLAKLAMQSADRGDSRAFDQWSEALFSLPAWSNEPLAQLPIALALAELVPLVDANRREDVARICRSLRFWNEPSDATESSPDDRSAFNRLINWAEEMERAAQTRQQTSNTASGSTPGGRRHPWLVEPGRDALSPAMGLAAAIAESALDDACKLITETPLPTDAGLVSDARDPRLAVSWSQAIRNALHDEPRLVAAMQAGFGRLGELRLSRAVAEGDAEAVRAATIQFLGTPVVAAAQLELGDRDLALGRFNQALATYQAGLRDASPDQADRLGQRVRLAASLIGMEVGRPARESVILNEKNLTAEQFEALLAARRRRAATGNMATGTMLPTDQFESRAAAGPPPGRYELRHTVSWESAIPAKSGAAAMGQANVLFAAQSAASIYITGALGITAVALHEPRTLWSYPPAGEHLLQNPLHMASAGDRIFWSRPVAEGRELTCLDALSGKVKWHKPRTELPVVSNPVWSQRQLFVVTGRPSAQGGQRIAVCELNPETGETLLQTDIGGLIAGETIEPHCALTAIDDRLVLATAAGVLCCDRAGNVHWLQRSTWLPAEIRSLAPDSHPETAMVVQPNAPLVVLQPGAPGLQAFDLETGRRVWQRAIPDLNRILTWGSGLIIAMTPRGLLAFQVVDGAFAWQQELSEQPFACGICDDGRVVTAAVQPDENGKQQLVLQWRAGRDGSSESITTLELPEPPTMSVECLGSTAGRFFIVGYDRERSLASLYEFVASETEKP